MMKSLRKSRGVATIEFVGGFTLFWAFCVAWVEIQYLSYISGVCDLVINKSAAFAKTHEEDYMDVFDQVIRQESSMWGNIDRSKFSLSVRYVKDLVELDAVNDDVCEPTPGTTIVECGIPQDRAIAIFTVKYDYESPFGFMYSFDSLLTREVIVLQEYERDKF